MQTISVPFLLAPLALLACGAAPDTVQGGELTFDAGPATTVPTTSLPSNCVAGGANATNSWADLYACYFGPMGVASCVHDGTCHVAGGTGGAIWLCGDSQASCQMGITSNGVVPSGGAKDWTTTTLYSALNKANGMGIGNMPATMGGGPPATYTFTDSDLSRIGAWVQGGAGP